jgi:uncharacterized protein GlcG (DUF336 family)
MQNLHSIDLNEAQKLTAAIFSAADISSGLGAISVAIIDIQGGLIFGARQPFAAAPTMDSAWNKAKTAWFYQRDTIAFRHSFSRTDNGWMPAIEGWSDRDVANARAVFPAFCDWAGGVLLKHEGAPVGAVGVSGREELEDHELAKLAFAHTLFLKAAD